MVCLAVVGFMKAVFTAEKVNHEGFRQIQPSKHFFHCVMYVCVYFVSPDARGIQPLGTLL